MCFLSRILKYQYVIHIFPLFPMSGIMETCGNKAPNIPETSYEENPDMKKTLANLQWISSMCEK